MNYTQTNSTSNEQKRDRRNIKLVYLLLNLVVRVVSNITAVICTYCPFAEAPLVVTQKLPVSTLPKVESIPEFAQDHESGLRSDRGTVVLCDFSKLRIQKSPYNFLNLYGRFCPYNLPYNPGHDTLPPNLQLYRFTLRKPGLEISFRM